MPVVLRVGPKEPEPVSASIFRLEIPGLFGFEPLRRLAAGVELEGRLPPPLDGPQMSWDLIDDASDAKVERFPTLLDAFWATFLPNNPEPTQEDEDAGDLDALLREARDLSRVIEGPPTLGEALAEIGQKPYATEWFSLLALLEAAHMAQHLNQPLSLWEWRYPLKPIDHPVSYRELFYWGLQDMVAVSLGDDGRRLDLEFAGGYRYQLPIDYIGTWRIGHPAGLRGTSCQVVAEGWVVELTLEDGTVRDLTTDTLLEACEPSYEDFGSYTEEAQKYIREGYARFGPFRVFPPEP